jgi:hypothetical protein
MFLLLLCLFNSFAPFVLVRCGNSCATCSTLAFLFSLLNVPPFFSLCSTLLLFYCLFNFVIPLSLLNNTTPHSLVGIVNSCVLYSTLLLLSSLLVVPSVACSHLGSSLLCCDVVAPMVLAFCNCSFCFKLVFFLLVFRALGLGGAIQIQLL